MSTPVRAIVAILGLVFGFAVAMIFLLAFNSLYRGTWMIFAIGGLLGAAFAWHPRLSQSRQTVPYLFFFGTIALALWMRSAGPSPLRIGQALSNSLPGLFLLLGVFSLALFAMRRGSTEPEFRYSWPLAIGFCLVGWAVVYFSGSNGGADPMVRWVETRFGLDADAAHLVIICVRKSLHFLFYGTVAATACTLSGLRFDVKRAAIFGLACALLFASFDEFRQSSSPGRTASVWDIGLDMVGALCLTGLSVLIYRRRVQPLAPVGRSES